MDDFFEDCEGFLGGNIYRILSVGGKGVLEGAHANWQAHCDSGAHRCQNDGPFHDPLGGGS